MGDMVDISGLKRELSGALEDIMLGETRLWLLKTLLSQKLVTWDIYYFAVKQAGLRDNIKSLDWPTMSAALKSKIKDVIQTLTKHRRKKSYTERKISDLSEDGRKDISLRRIIRPLLEPIKKLKKARMKKFEMKIGHYKTKQSLNGPTETRMAGEDISKKITYTRVPRRLKEYSDLRIFLKPNDLPKPVDPVGAFIGSKDIHLSENEKMLLNKDPKYSLRYSTNTMDFQIELERMMSKQRYGQGRTVNSREMKIKTEKVDEIQQAIEKITNVERPDDPRITALEEQWKSVEKSLVYDPLKNRLNFNNRRVTDYKHNKKVILPGPMTSDLELESELRRKLYLKSFNEYIQKEEIQPKDRKNTKKEILNLSKNELKGLDSLKKRIKNNELVVTTTDKSGRLAVLTEKQYVEAGECHTKKDCQIGWNEIKYLQGQINSHTWWLSSIIGNSLKTNPERMNKNIQGSGFEIPELSLLVKDHKEW